MLSKRSTSNVQVLLLSFMLVSILTLVLIVCQSRFNFSEINLLVEKAEEHELEYELVIHNQFTNSYSFNILNVDN